MDEDRLVEAIERIYAAVGHPDEWPRALQAIAGVTGAASGCILAASGLQSGNVSSFHEIDPDWIQHYNDWFYRYDPSPSVIEANPGRVMVDSVTGPRPADLTGDRLLFYNELMRPQGFRHTLHTGLSETGQRNLGIILQRPAGPGPFSQAQIAALQKLASHLHRALLLHARLQSVDGMVAGLTVALDRISMGVILLDEAGAVVHTNARAEQLLRTSSVLRLESRELTASSNRDNQPLKRLIAAAVTRDGMPSGPTLRLQGASDPGLIVQVTPLNTGESAGSLAPAGVRAAVWLGTYEPSDLCSRTLALMYNLSPTEGELLARLIEGKQLSEIATLRAVSLYTVRTQLKTLMSKLGVSRQVDLVRMVMSGPGLIQGGIE